MANTDERKRLEATLEVRQRMAGRFTGTAKERADVRIAEAKKALSDFDTAQAKAKKPAEVAAVKAIAAAGRVEVVAAGGTGEKKPAAETRVITLAELAAQAKNGHAAGGEKKPEDEVKAVEVTVAAEKKEIVVEKKVETKTEGEGAKPEPKAEKPAEDPKDAKAVEVTVAAEKKEIVVEKKVETKTEGDNIPLLIDEGDQPKEKKVESGAKDAKVASCGANKDPGVKGVVTAKPIPTEPPVPQTRVIAVGQRPMSPYDMLRPKEGQIDAARRQWEEAKTDSRSSPAHLERLKLEYERLKLREKAFQIFSDSHNLSDPRLVEINDRLDTIVKSLDALRAPTPVERPRRPPPGPEADHRTVSLRQEERLPPPGQPEQQKRWWQERSARAAMVLTGLAIVVIVGWALFFRSSPVPTLTLEDLRPATVRPVGVPASISNADYEAAAVRGGGAKFRFRQDPKKGFTCGRSYDLAEHQADGSYLLDGSCVRGVLPTTRPNS